MHGARKHSHGNPTSGAERATKRADTAAVPEPAKYTFDDFCVLVKEDQKADLIDGVIYMASPENLDANDRFMWLGFLMNGFAGKTDQGKVYGSRVAFRLGDVGGPEPDLAFVKKDRLHLRRRGFFQGPPDLAVEIVSPDSIERDYELKRAQYEAAGVSEYWIVDEFERKVTLLRLAANGKYREVKARKGELHSVVLRGFWLRPEWLWQEPLPLHLDILQELLDRLGPPAKP
jgi:Uma2 family endonuclease